MKWSFSADRCFRRCQRQYFFREIAAWHNARDPLRREAFLLKQVKTAELWRGQLVHQGIEQFVVPLLEANQSIDWEAVVEKTLDMAARQVQFSEARRYREKGVTKNKYPLEYCALQCHEGGDAVSPEELEGVFESVRAAFTNLSQMTELWKKVAGRGRYWCEVPIVVSYEGVRLEAKPDLMFFRSFGKPTIIDWKVYEDASGSDGHLQVALYAWALCRHDKWRVSRAEDVELLEVQLLENRVITHGFSEDVFDELEDRIYRSIHDIRALTGGKDYESQELSDYAFAESQNSCAFCNFRKPCLENHRWSLM